MDQASFSARFVQRRLALADGHHWELREDMLDAIRQSVVRTADYTGRSKLSDRVMEQMGAVPRHEFVTADMKSRAYLNTALPITDALTSIAGQYRFVRGFEGSGLTYNPADPGLSDLLQMKPGHGY